MAGRRLLPRAPLESPNPSGSWEEGEGAVGSTVDTWQSSVEGSPPEVDPPSVALALWASAVVLVAASASSVAFLSLIHI